MSSAARTRRARSLHRQRGQVLVIVAVAFIPIIAMVALIVDGGYAWAQQRIDQNGSDAASEAGATVLSRRVAGQAPPGAGWDSEVASHVAALAADNGITVPDAYYTDVCGTPLTIGGVAALSNLSNAARVGSGFPVDGALTAPDCTLPQPRPAGSAAGAVAGVYAFGQHTFQTFFAPIVGIYSFTARTEAKAVTGPLQAGCAADEGVYCTILPIAVWYQHNHCDDQGKFVDDGSPWQIDDGTAASESIIPLCKGSGNPGDGSGSGNVGWIDWGNNVNSGISGVCDSIVNPDNPGVTLPVWLAAGQTGDSGTCFPDVDAYHDDTVLIPIYDYACGNQNGQPTPATGVSPYNCTDLVANGSQAWYHTTMFAAFKVDTTYTTEAQCGSGNGSTSCLTGWFEGYVTGGNVGSGSGGSGAVIGVQLIH
jgi:Putative Flp pilus-assembly TadE/G-like